MVEQRHPGGRPPKITKEIYRFVVQKSEEGLSPKEINALLREKYGIRLGATTIYRVKKGEYPEPNV